MIIVTFRKARNVTIGGPTQCPVRRKEQDSDAECEVRDEIQYSHLSDMVTSIKHEDELASRCLQPDK